MVLHSTTDEMAFVLDLLNSIDHKTATGLRRHIDPLIRCNNKFTIHIDTKFEICHECKGEGTVNSGSLREMHNHDNEDCEVCRGHGRRRLVITKRYENISAHEAEG